MRQVIRRFLKHLDAEKNASATTIETYRYDLYKFDLYLVKRLGNRFLPGDVSRDHIRDYLIWLSEVGHQKPNGPSARARALAAIRSFFKYAHRAGLLRDNPAADIALPKIRMGEIRALSQDECGRLLRVVETNRSPFIILTESGEPQANAGDYEAGCPCFQRDDPTDEYFWPKARLGKRLSSCCERRRESNDRQSRCSDRELSETSC